MRRHGYPLLLTFGLALGGACAFAARVDVELEGIEQEEMQEAVRATLELAEYKDRDISPAALQASFKQADEQIRKALEPFGYYDVAIDKNLSGDATGGWKARFVVQPGEPVKVGDARVEVRGEGLKQRRVEDALQGFVPKPGERFDHASYEASKSVIDTSLRGSGYLDAEYAERRVTVRPESQAADIALVWDSGPRYRFGDVRFSGDVPFPESFLREFVTWREDAWFNSEQVLNLQQRLVDADYFELVSVQPAMDEKKDGRVPIDVLLNRDERTVYTGEVYYSTDFGAGVRLGAERRWINKRGHKADAEIEYSQRLEEYAVHYQIPRPGRDDRSYDYGIGYRDETTDVSRSRNFQLAATRTERRWHGFTRTIGLKYLTGDFQIGPDDENPEFGSSKLLWAEGTLSRRRVNDKLAPRRGYLFNLGLRLASDAVLSDTDIAQAFSSIIWLKPFGDRARLKLRGEVGAMAVGDFDALPPDLRFYAGGDRSIRGFDYHEIGETNANGTVIGGQYLAIASAEYDYYFTEDWGAAAFVDAGDAFTNGFSVNVGVGVGVRWRSPLGPIRVDFGFPVKSAIEPEDDWRLHVLLGPEL